MMECKHDYMTLRSVQFEFSPQVEIKFCWHCGKTVKEMEIENELAAANARITKLHDDEAMERIYQDGLHSGAIEANKRIAYLEEEILRCCREEGKVYGVIWSKIDARQVVRLHEEIVAMKEAQR